MSVTALAIGSLTAASGSLQGVVTLTGTPSYPYIVSFIVNDVTSITSAGDDFAANSITISSGSTGSFTISNLTNGTEYAIVAYDNEGIVSSAATGRPSSVPVKPIISVVSTDETSVKLLINYGESQGSDCVGYPVFVKAADGTSITKSAANTSGFAYAGKTVFTSEFIVTGLTSGKLYEFALNTKNAVGLSLLSNTVHATPSNVVNAPGTPVLTFSPITPGHPDLNSVTEVTSTVAMPSDHGSFFIAAEAGTAPTPKYEIYTDFYKNGIKIGSEKHTLTAVFTGTGSSKAYDGTFTSSSVIMQIAKDTAVVSMTITAKSRSVMKTNHNDNNIVDQVSGASNSLVVAGQQFMANDSVLAQLKARVEVATFNDTTTRVSVIPYFKQDVTALMSRDGVTGLTHSLRIMSPSDDLNNQNLLPVNSVFLPGLVYTAASAPATMTGAVTFDVVTADDLAKSVKFQVKSTFTINGSTISTRWTDVPTSSIPLVALYTKPDDVTNLVVLNSEQSSNPAVQLKWDVPTVIQKRGLIVRDYELYVKVASATSWAKYSENISNTFNGITYKSLLPDNTTFVPGTSYMFKVVIRGSVTADSSVYINGDEAISSAVILSPNCFKNLESQIDVVNADASSIVAYNKIAWVSAVAGPPAVAARSDTIDFVEDSASAYFIPVASRASISIIYIIDGQDQASGSYQKQYSLTNGVPKVISIQAKYTYTFSGVPTTIYSKVYTKTLNPSGVPTITLPVSPATGLSYTYTSAGVEGSKVDFALIPVGATNKKSVFTATLEARGSALISYTAIFVPIEFSSTIAQSDLIKSNVSITDSTLVDGVLTLTPSFLAKACILYVTNANGSVVKFIPANAVISA